MPFSKRLLPWALYTLLLSLIFGPPSARAQGTAEHTSITGAVVDAATGDSLAGVSIAVKGTVLGTLTGGDGAFELDVDRTPPLTLAVSLVGYAAKEVPISEPVVEGLTIELDEEVIEGEEVVVSASRTPQQVMRSPTAVEKMDLADLQETASPDFYSALDNLKGVDLVTQSMTHKAVNVRGFGGAYNVRFVQVIDGIDNQAPGLNFPVGNIVGISELDLESVELLPGASSALYGPNAMNGVLLMRSKSPFEYQGLSARAQIGANHLTEQPATNRPVLNLAGRYATSIGDRFAFKVNASLLSAEDWYGETYEDQNAAPGATFPPPLGDYAPGVRNGDPGYDGVHVYGDEPSINLQATALGAGLPESLVRDTIPNETLTRTGYRERDLWDYDATSLKANAALHYRLTDNAEMIVQGDYGTGNTVYTASYRYAFSDFRLWRVKAELQGTNYFVRAYTTQERSGDSHALGTLGQQINNSWKPYTQWFEDYLISFFQARTGIATGEGLSVEESHHYARRIADEGRPAPGSERFNALRDSLVQLPLPDGAGFVDKSNLYEASAQYNFDRLLDFAEIIVGGNYRVYDLNSNGSLFADANRDLSIREYGAYAQAERGFLGDRLRLTATLRLDKNENFDAQLSPRFSAVYTLAGQHNVRASYQTAFRNPTTQDQYQNIVAPSEIVIGGLPEFRDRYNMIDNPVYSRDNVDEFHAVYDQAIEDGEAPADALDEARAVLEKYAFGKFKPEQLRSIEVGYRGRLFDERLFLDSYYYYNFYNDFLGSVDLVQSDTLDADGTPNPIGFLNGDQNVYDTPVNVQNGTVTTQGFAVGGGYRLPANFTLEGNLAYNVFNDADNEDLNTPPYNTPAWRTNLSLSYRDRRRGMGAKVSFRRQSAYQSGGNFVGEVPAFSTVNAQVTFDLSALNTRLKIGGSNILNDRHFTGYGNPTVGTQVYVSVTYDQFLN